MKTDQVPKGAFSSIRCTWEAYVMCNRWTRSLSFRLFLVLVTLFAPVAPLAPRVARADEETKPSAPTDEELKQALAELGGYGKALSVLQSRIDPTAFDVAELAKSLGSDPAKCFEYVRDRVGIEPYAGLLRGSKGTLVAGAGNPLDRAVLLGDLIRRAGKFEVRVVHGTLEKKDAQRLLDEALARWQAPPAIQERHDEEQIRDLAQQSGVDVEKLLRGWKDQNDRDAKMREEVEKGTTEDLAYLSETLKSAGVEVGKTAATSCDALVAGLEDHFWLQIREGETGKWQDLDPSWKDATLGARAGTATSQFPLDGIPKKLLHTVHVQFMLERVVEGKREDVELLGKTLACAACVGQGICIAVVPADVDNATAMSVSNESRQEKAKIYDRMTKFQPVLDWEGGLAGGKPFDFNGQIFEVTSKGVLGLGDLFGSLTNGLNEAMAQASGEAKKSALASIRMEWTIQGPGRATRTETRVLLDRIAPEKRVGDQLEVPPFADANAERAAKMELLREYGAFVTPGRLSPPFVDSLSIRSTLMAVGLATEMCACKLEKRAFSTSSFQGHCHLPRDPLLAFEVLREARLDRARDAGYAAFYAAPTVALYSLGTRPTGEGTARTIVTFDILDCPTTYVALPGRETSVTPATVGFAMAQGVADTRLERALLADTAKERGMSAIDVFRVTRETGVSVRVLTPDSAADADKLALPDEARRRIRADLAAGCVVIAPEKAVRLGDREGVAWWRVDPSSGRVLGILGDGSGGEAVEELEIEFQIITGLIGAVLCMNIAMMDRDFLSPQDLAVCLLTGVGGGLAATSGRGILGAIVAALGTGLWLNKDFGDMKWGK